MRSGGALGRSHGRTGYTCSGVFVAAALVLAVNVAAPAQANVASRISYARGLIAFHQARWNEALTAFDRAVRADPNDARARYYRGLTWARLGDTPRAVEDLEAALQQDGSLPHATLDLGIAYLSLQRWGDAETALRRAWDRGEERRVAAFFLGVALFQQGRAEEALAYFREAQADPEVRPAAAYYAALIQIEQGQTQAARSLLESVTRELPGSEIALAAQEYLSRGEVGFVRRAGERPWSAYGALAFEYDTNVSLGPKDQPPSVATDVTEKSDGRTVLSAGARYALLDEGEWSASLGYDFSQSLHFDLRRFDLQGHRLGGRLAWHRNVLTAGLAAAYGFYALDYQSFFHEGWVAPYATWHLSEAAATQGFLRFRGRDFLRKPYDPGRDARNYAPGVRQFFTLGSPDRVLMLGYEFEIEDTVSGGPQGRTFDYEAHELRAETTWAVAAPLVFRAGYAFRSYSYQHRESGFGERKRSDDAHEFALLASYGLSPHWSIVGGYIGQLHDSNVRVFEYDRHIVSVGVQLAY